MVKNSFFLLNFMSSFFCFLFLLQSYSVASSLDRDVSLTTFVQSLEQETFQHPNNNRGNFVAKSNIMASIVDRIKKNYFDNVSSDEMFQFMIKGLFDSLDPYSGYVSQKEYDLLLNKQKGFFVGVGLELITQNNFHVVVSCLPNSPSEKFGIRTGDKLIRVDGVSVLESSLELVILMVQGVPGSSIHLTFLRDGQEKNFYLQRCSIKEKMIRDICLIDGDIGYLKIPSFAKGVTVALSSSIRLLRKSNIRGLILDLRNNSGGLLEEAVHMTSLFIKPKNLILTVENKHTKKEYFSHQNKRIETIPLCLLINEGSASAAEVVAGAFQDHKRATIIGERSFGKGSIQTLIPIPFQGGAIRLTTHRYVLPKGSLVEDCGIVPDILIATPSLQDFFSISYRQKKKWKGNALIPILSKEIQDRQVFGAIKDLQP